MPPINVRSCVAIAAALCVVISLARFAESFKSQSEKHDEGRGNGIASSGTGKEPQFQLDLGPFVFNGYFNHTEYQDKLRLSKSDLKFVISNKLGGPKVAPLASYKVTTVMELMRCENFTLSEPELLPSIECLPLAEQIRKYGDNVSPSLISSRSAGDYIRRISSRQKSSSFGGPSHRLDIASYPLADSVVQHEINTVLAEHNMPGGVGRNVENFGMYVESKTDSNGIWCSSKLFFSLNKEAAIAQKPLGQWQSGNVFEMLHDAYRQGVLVAVKDYSCSSKKPGIIFSRININFSFIKRKEFPYVSCRHTMMATPLAAILQYEGKIEQTRDETQPGEAYNTTVNVRSQSGLFDSALLNFQLEQTFENKDFQNGRELMVLATEHFAARVDGLWTAENLAKILTISSYEKDSAGKPISAKESIVVSYVDKNDEFLDLKFKVRRDLVSGLLSRSIDSIVPNSEENNDSASPTSGENNNAAPKSFKDEL